MTAATLIASYGYPIVILGTILEGEAVVIAAGYLARRHHLSVELVAVCAAVGGATGNQIWFLLGRRYGDRLLERLPRSIRKSLSGARDAVRRNPVRVLISMRFFYGMRIALPSLCGASGMSPWRFTRYNVATAIVWSLLFTGIGYAFGAAATAAIHEVRRYEWLLLAVIVAVGILIQTASRPLRRWLEKAGELGPKPKAPGRP